MKEKLFFGCGRHWHCYHNWVYHCRRGNVESSRGGESATTTCPQRSDNGPPLWTHSEVRLGSEAVSRRALRTQAIHTPAGVTTNYETALASRLPLTTHGFRASNHGICFLTLLPVPAAAPPRPPPPPPDLAARRSPVGGGVPPCSPRLPAATQLMSVSTLHRSASTTLSVRWSIAMWVFSTSFADQPPATGGVPLPVSFSLCLATLLLLLGGCPLQRYTRSEPQPWPAPVPSSLVAHRLQRRRASPQCPGVALCSLVASISTLMAPLAEVFYGACSCSSSPLFTQPQAGGALFWPWLVSHFYWVRWQWFHRYHLRLHPRVFRRWQLCHTGLANCFTQHRHNAVATTLVPPSVRRRSRLVPRRLGPMIS